MGCSPCNWPPGDWQNFESAWCLIVSVEPQVYGDFRNLWRRGWHVGEYLCYSAPPSTITGGPRFALKIHINSVRIQTPHHVIIDNAGLWLAINIFLSSQTQSFPGKKSLATENEFLGRKNWRKRQKLIAFRNRHIIISWRGMRSWRGMVEWDFH